MDGFSSGSSSVLSFYSLEEGANKNKSEKDTPNVNKNVSNLSEVTVPFYGGDVAIEEVKKSPSINRRRAKLNNSVKKDLNLNSLKSNSKSIVEKSENPSSFQASYYTFSDKKCQSARIENRSRVSRRNSWQENSDPSRCRNKSVSYLEHFRKKLYGTNQDTPLSNSDTCKDQDKSMSCTSYISAKSKRGTSEFEFYLDLTKNTENKQLTIENHDEVHLETSTPTKPKTYTQNKEKPITLCKIRDIKQESEKKELDKRKALEKREAYASQVKLINRIKINHQKEKEKLERIKHFGPKQNTSMEDGLCYNHKCITETSKCCNDLPPPFSINQMANIEWQPKTKACPKKKVSKSHRTRQNKRELEEKISNLTVLQQRHESEKNLVDSIRSLVLKT